MKAMILAAGLGTRLRPLTDDRPKALVDVAGSPMIDWVIRWLTRHGFTDIIINAHHFAEQIEAFVAGHDHAGVSLTVSVEDEILGTGGGVRQASWFFDDEPFLVHNVDVLTDLDLSGLIKAHQADTHSESEVHSAAAAHSESEVHSAAAARVTVAVKRRKSTRHLLFDTSGWLCGWKSDVTGETRMVRPPQGDITPVPFMGVYAMSPGALERMPQAGPFSMIDFFLDLAGDGEGVRAFPADAARWADLGSKDRIDAAEAQFGRNWFEGLIL